MHLITMRKKNQSKSENNSNEEMNEEYIQTVVLERVIKYIKLDDLIKEKQNEHKKEMKAIKDAKEHLEKFLITYLDKIDEEYIQVGKNQHSLKLKLKRKHHQKWMIFLLV